MTQAWQCKEGKTHNSGLNDNDHKSATEHHHLTPTTNTHNSRHKSFRARTRGMKTQEPAQAGLLGHACLPQVNFQH